MKLVLLKSGRATELVFKMIGAFRQTCVSSKWLYLHTNLQSKGGKLYQYSVIETLESLKYMPGIRWLGR